jgi:signal transduction histidine kinase
MRPLFIIRLTATALIVALAGRAVYLEIESQRREYFTKDLCQLVDNYLETSAVRSAYEGIKQGVARSPYAGACVSVIDIGIHYAPNCLDSDINYQLTVCQPEGNKGIRAEIYYPVSLFFSGYFFLIWALIGCVLTVMTLSFQFFAAQMTEELKNRLFGESSKSTKETSFSRIVHWLLVKSGVLQGVREQAEKFQSQLGEYEARIKSEAILRAQKEIEVKKANEHLADIQRIRHDLTSPLSSFLAVQAKFVGDEASRQTLASGILMVNKMLDRLSNREASEEAPKFMIVEVVAEEVVMLLQRKFQNSKRVKLTLEYDSDNLSPVMATSEGLTRVFNNLLENAFDALTSDGLIHVRIGSEGPFCNISVEDDGCGIPLEVIPKLFSKGATFGKVNGTGYGLYQCKSAIESWGGKIAVEPLPKGTCFIVLLPRVQAGVAFVGLPKTKKLWVIDDDPTVAQVLDQAGYAVVSTALTYREGEALLKTIIPENVAVLVDFRLDGDYRGTDLIAGKMGLHQMVLCTHDFEDEDVIKRARQVGIRILPKPLCLLAEPKAD